MVQLTMRPLFVFLALCLLAGTASAGSNSANQDKTMEHVYCLKLVEAWTNKAAHEEIIDVCLKRQSQEDMGHCMLGMAVLKKNGFDPSICSRLEFSKENDAVLMVRPAIARTIKKGLWRTIVINPVDGVMESYEGRRSDKSSFVEYGIMNANPTAATLTTPSGGSCLSFEGKQWCRSDDMAGYVATLKEYMSLLRGDGKVYSVCKINPKGKAQERYVFVSPLGNRFFYSDKAKHLEAFKASSVNEADFSNIHGDVRKIRMEEGVKACKKNSVCMHVNNGERVWTWCSTNAADLDEIKAKILATPLTIPREFTAVEAYDNYKWAIGQLLATVARRTLRSGALTTQVSEVSLGVNSDLMSSVVGMATAMKFYKSNYSGALKAYLGAEEFKYLIGEIASGHTDNIGDISASPLACTLQEDLEDVLPPLAGMSACPRADNAEATVATPARWSYDVTIDTAALSVSTDAVMFVPKVEEKVGDEAETPPRPRMGGRGIAFRLETEDDIQDYFGATGEKDSELPGDKDELAVPEDDDEEEDIADDAHWPKGEPMWAIKNSNAITIGTSWRTERGVTPFKFWLVNAYKTNIGGHTILRHGNINFPKWTASTPEPSDWPLKTRKYEQFMAWISHLGQSGQIVKSSSGRYRVRSLSTVANHLVTKGDTKMWKQQHKLFEAHKDRESVDTIHINLAGNIFSETSTGRDTLGAFTFESIQYANWIIEDTLAIVGADAVVLSDLLKATTVSAKLKGIDAYFKKEASKLRAANSAGFARVLAAFRVLASMQSTSKASRVFEIMSLALMDNALGVVSAINCRSGLDRTGWIFSAHVMVSQAVELLGRDAPETWSVMLEIVLKSGTNNFITVANELDSIGSFASYEAAVTKSCGINARQPTCIVARMRVFFYSNLMNVGYKVINYSTGIPGFKWLQTFYGTVRHHHVLFPTWLVSQSPRGSHPDTEINIKESSVTSGFGRLLKEDILGFLLGGCKFRGA